MEPPEPAHKPSALSEALQNLEGTGRERRYRADEVIFREGDPGDGFYLVESGQVRITAAVSGMEQRLLTTIGPGDYFGEMAVLDQGVRSASASAETDTVAWFIARDALLEVISREPNIALELIREFSGRVRQLNHKFIDELRLSLVGRFARMIVHDFKNPLNIIGLSAELGIVDSIPPAARKEAQQRIARQVKRMNNMLNELIEFTRAANTQVEPEPSDYGANIEQVIPEVAEDVAPRKVQVTLPASPPSVLVRFDPHRLGHLFHNLVNNAADAMPKGGVVIVRFQLKPTEIITEVEDTGSGIAPEIVGRLFEAFATFGKAHGTGLGLSICKKIVEDHGGRIWARSEPGRGAIFSFALPLAR